MYDRYGEEGLSGDGGGMGGMNPEDLFSQLFGGGMFGGGGGRRGPQAPRRGKDMAHQLKVSLEDLYRGKTSKLALQKTVICSGCQGKGGKDGAVRPCGGCNGRGVRIVVRQIGPMIQQMQQPCPDCNGEGEIIKDKDRCKQCQGRKVLTERKILEVHIDKGMIDGQRIVFNGEGDQAPGIEPGDIIIILDEKDHPRFKRKENDLYTNVQIDLITALSGGKFSVEHLDDRVLLVDIQPGTVIKPGDVKCIREEGMPSTSPSFLVPFVLKPFLILAAAFSFLFLRLFLCLCLHHLILPLHFLFISLLPLPPHEPPPIHLTPQSLHR